MSAVREKLGTRHRARRGMLIIEVAVAALLVGAAMVLVSQATRLCALQQRNARQECVARAEANNLLEQITAREDLQAGAVAVNLSEQAEESLPDAAVTATAKPSGQLLRIVVVIDWQRATGGRSQGVKLVTWVRNSDAGEQP